MQAGLAIQNTKALQNAAASGANGRDRRDDGGAVALDQEHPPGLARRGGLVEMGIRNNNLPQSTKGWRVVDRNLDKIYN